MEATVRNLRDEVFEKHKDKRFLYCPRCGGEYSAHKGDYWNLPDSYVFKCCGEPMIIATSKTIISEV